MSDSQGAAGAAESIAGAQEAAEGGANAEASAAAAPAKAPEKVQLTDQDIMCNLALQDKDKGAVHYKAQQYAAAQDCWNRALERLEGAGGPGDPDLKKLYVSLYLNLAQAALLLKEYEEVVTHSAAAIRIDSENAKAFYRRGIANDALGKVHSAAKDLQNAARLEPQNAEVRKKYEEAKKKAVDCNAEEEDVPPVHDLMKLSRAFIDVAIGDSPPRRLVLALYKDIVPRTVENFRKLCAGEHKGITVARGKPFHYKGSVLHRMIPGLMVQGGDFENANGTGGESIYGRRFPDEAFRDKHTRRGLIAMANDGPNTNGSGFFITFAPAEHLDRRHVVFGEVSSGGDLLDDLEKLPTNAEGRPLTDCVIVDCGECGPGGTVAGS